MRTDLKRKPVPTKSGLRLGACGCVEGHPEVRRQSPDSVEPASAPQSTNQTVVRAER